MAELMPGSGKTILLADAEVWGEARILVTAAIESIARFEESQVPQVPS